MHRTLLNEDFRIKGREKWYESVDEMQSELDEYLIRYNTKRPHQGRNMGGKTPYDMFVKGLPKKHKSETEKIFRQRDIKKQLSGGECQVITITVHT